MNDMPKMKSNRYARKKLRIGGTGVIKRAQANTSHNTSKRGAKRRRHLRGRKVVDATNTAAVLRMLPALSKQG